MPTYSNKIQVVGRFCGHIVESHQVEGQIFYTCIFVVKRLSGTADFLSAIIPDSAIKGFGADDLFGGPMRLTGEIRVYGRFDDRDRKTHFDANLYVHRIEKAPGASDDNQVALSGIISKPPTFRVTPFGREICDLMLMICRGYGKKSFIPCVAWGLSARRAAKWKVGDQVHLTGRFQNREYEKALANGTKQKRMAYEVSISSITKEKEKK